MIDPFSWIATGAQTLASLQIADKNYKSQQETNAANERSVAATNAANERMVAATNAANVEQANIAYERSKPVTQVANMMDAGMSKAGALNSLSGGGVYTPPALSTASAQSSTQQAPQFDYSGIAQAIDRFANIPSNVMQRDIQSQQLADLKQQAQLRLNEEHRKQEMHDALIDEKKYSKWERESMDSFFSLMENTAQQKNIQPSSNQSMHDYVRALGLQDTKEYKQLSASGRQRAFDKYKQIQEEKRAQQSSRDSHIASIDAHDLAELQKAIQRINVKYYNKEKTEQLLNLMRVGQGYIQDNNIKFADLQAKEMENLVREAGIDNEREARQLAEYVNKLRKEDALFVADKADKYPIPMKHFRAGVRLFLSDLGEILSKVNL